MRAAREPALWAALAGVAIKLVSAFWIDLTTDQQSVMNAAVVTAVGLIVAAMTRDGLSAAILGMGQAMIALALGFGLKLDPDDQATIMSAVSLGVAMFVRTQVVAPVPPKV